MQVIYIDVLFILNLIMDFIIFLISNLFLGTRVRTIKLLIGSLLAAILYCCTLYIPCLQKGFTAVYALSIPILPIIYMFKPKKIKIFFKICLVCNIVAFVIGGATFNVYYLCLSYNKSIALSILIPVLVALGLLVITSTSFYWIRKCFIQPYFEYTLTLQHKGKACRIISLLDTGNCLYTALGHKPVIIIDYTILKSFLTPEWIEVVEACKCQGVLQTLSKTSYPNLHIQVIPFKSIGCKEGLLLGTIIEEVEVKRGEHKKIFKECVIGICYTTLFAHETYEALLHPDFIRYS